MAKVPGATGSDRVPVDRSRLAVAVGLDARLPTPAATTATTVRGLTSGTTYTPQRDWPKR